MTPLDDYIRKNPPEHPFFRNLGSRLLVALSLTLAIACLVGIGFFPFIVPFWGLFLAACYLMDRKTGKRALLGIPFVVPVILLWFVCLLWGCAF